ncbi:TadE/TadG family type IV pilus assembly protein [Occallatibacter savannae]|uniref:TadE/TadG family type IV pilus assembly protein n=1 Tax=Occallatibacter savannae TaxID=1002691 RepID=UPI000D69446C|nr:TadE/TadG family type IV pilus assembly protein [Occallatibacter savannae]
MLRKFAREEGGALVETALSMTLLIVLLLGAVEFGRLAYAAIQVNSAAKAAAQYGAQSRATAADISGMTSAAQSEYFGGSTLQLISPTSTTGTSCTCADTGSAAVCSNNSVTSPACPGSVMEVTITVQTQTSFSPLFNVPGMPGPFTITGTAKQKVLQ